MMSQPRRKKWSEAEERSLIDKYGEMVCDGSLAKMKTREKKFKPIAFHVNLMHHVRNPIVYPWQWTWKDVSTKVQNMRHQYALVKQKIRKVEMVNTGGEEFDWMEGVTYWSNFLRYKEVFGDVSVVFSSSDSLTGGFDHGLEDVQFGNLGDGSGSGEFPRIDGEENGVMGLGFDYDNEEGEEKYEEKEGFVYAETEPDINKKRKKVSSEKRALSILSYQMKQLKEMETRFEEREIEREKKREELARVKMEEWEKMEKENEEKERRRREEELVYEREREERMNIRRLEWKKRMDEMLSQHRAEMSQMQSRILNDQQNVTSQLLGMISQTTNLGVTVTDHTSVASNHYFSQMMQNMQHVNVMVNGDTRVDADNQEDQFIVDG